MYPVQLLDRYYSLPVSLVFTESVILIKLALVDRIKFLIERQFVKGAGFQLLVVAVGIGLITLFGGLAVALTGFDGNLLEALWWAFLRLTDPGYLGDDDGGWKRLVSTLLTISGYVVFLGALVAIMTQWLIARMRDFERGLTPVSMKDHVVIVGWSNRTIPLLRELFGSDRSKKQYQNAFESRRLRVVVLSEGVTAAQAQALRTDSTIGKHARDIILRDGSPLEDEAIHRAGCLNAALVIMPTDFTRINRRISLDVEMIRSLLSIDSRAVQSGTRPPLIIAELQDVRRADMARNAYNGSLELLPSDDTFSRLLTQNILHPGLSSFYREVLTAEDGNEVMLRSAKDLAGASLRDIAVRCPKALVLGLIRDSREGRSAQLNLSSDTRILASDAIIFLARELADIEPAGANASATLKSSRHAATRSLKEGKRRYRILLLGWSRRLPNLLSEMAAYSDRRFDIDLVSTAKISERNAALQDYGVTLKNIELRHHEADYLLDGTMERFDLTSYQTIFFLSSDLMASEEEADARAIVGHRLVEGLLSNLPKRPQVLLELSDAANEGLVRLPGAEIVISPLVISHLLARIALQPETRLVFDELFGPDGVEVEFRSVSDYGLSGDLSMEHIETAVAERGDLLLGLECGQDSFSNPSTHGHSAGSGEGNHARELKLNVARSETVKLGQSDRLCILTGQTNV